MSAPTLLHSVDGCEVWHGDCLNPDHVIEIMGERNADLLCVDAPYSERTHVGHAGGAHRANCGSYGPTAEKRYAAKHGNSKRKELNYDSWSPGVVDRFCHLWMPVVSGWAVSITDHGLQPAWSEGFERLGRYVFAPLPWVETGSRVRMTGDGPSCWSSQVVVARPKCEPYSKWGTLPGAYIMPAENHQSRPERITGGKSLAGMIRLIGDYSRRGDLVLDTCLGGGTAVVTARMTGRRCIGVEIDGDRAELCSRLLSKAREQVTLFDGIDCE